MRKCFCAFTLFVAIIAGGNLAALASGPVTSASMSQFTVADRTLIPGRTLPVGTYTMRIVDRLTDRLILRVEEPGGRTTTFLALRSKGALSTKGLVCVKGAAEATSAGRSFGFQDGTVAEFVYPKMDAVALAKANGSTFPAIDPESEGRPVSSSLSDQDMKEVTLWMLTPKPVGAGESGAGIAATRYQQVAGVRSVRPRVAALPHTASELPLLALLGVSTLTAAGFVRYNRVTRNASQQGIGD